MARTYFKIYIIGQKSGPVFLIMPTAIMSDVNGELAGKTWATAQQESHIISLLLTVTIKGYNSSEPRLGEYREVCTTMKDLTYFSQQFLYARLIRRI